MLEQPTPRVLSLERGLSVAGYRRLAVYRRLAAAAALAALALIFGVGLALFFQQPILFWGLAIPVVLLPLIWLRPALTVYLLVAGAATFESFNLNFPDSFTDRVPFFMSFSSLGLALPLPITPVELFMVATLLIVMLRRMAAQERPLETGPLFWSIACYSMMVLFGLVHGIGTGGNITTALWEARAQVYLFLVYLLVFNLVRQRSQVRLLFWVLLSAVALKGLIGSWRYLVTLGGDLAKIDVLSTHNSLLSHEESFFFAVFFIIIFVMVMLRSDRRQLGFALLLSPPVLLAFLANQRRAGTLALVLGIAVAALLVYILVRHRRRLLTKLAIAGAILLPVYVLAFGNSTGLMAEPANAIISMFQPDARDLSSNTYRLIETENLKYNIMMDPILGRGYGKPIVMFLPLPDLTGIFGFWEVIPHNTLLWLWMRTGFLGFVAFWFMIGRIIMEACLVARSQRDPYFVGVGILAIAATVSWLGYGAVDMGLVDFRSTIVLGTLVGLVSRISEQQGIHAPAQNR